MSDSHQRCVLLRHGETQWSLDGRHTGRTDLPLLPEGEAQARALQPRLTGYRFAAVFTSPLLRAQETCALAGLGAEAVIDPDLAEWDYGDYEGVTTAEIRRTRPGWDLFSDGAPGGEDSEQVAERCDRVIGRIRTIDGDVACVAHSHLLRVLAARWIELDATGGRHLVLSPASVSELTFERDHPVISLWNSH